MIFTLRGLPAEDSSLTCPQGRRRDRVHPATIHRNVIDDRTTIAMR
jgi:hypothetical protein